TALHCGVGHVAAVDRESWSYSVEERLGVGALDCVGRGRVERVDLDARVTRRRLHLAQSRDLLAVEVGVLGELGKRSFYMYGACAHFVHAGQEWARDVQALAVRVVLDDGDNGPVAREAPYLADVVRQGGGVDLEPGSESHRSLWRGQRPPREFYRWNGGRRGEKFAAGDHTHPCSER